MPILVVAALIHRFADPDKRLLIVRRGPGQSGAGHWEFPGGKVERGESPEQALAREILEELDLPIRVGTLFGEVEHAYPSKTIRLRLYWAESLHGDLKLTEHDAFKWMLPAEIDVLELSEADRPFVAQLLGK